MYIGEGCLLVPAGRCDMDCKSDAQALQMQMLRAEEPCICEPCVFCLVVDTDSKKR